MGVRAIRRRIGRILGIEKADHRVVLSKANSLRDSNRPAEAAEQYRLALAYPKTPPEVRTQYANMLKDSGQYDLAYSEYIRYLTLNPEDADTHLQLGHLFKLKGDREQAIRHYRVASQASPPSEDAQNELFILGEALPEIQIQTVSYPPPKTHAVAHGPVSSSWSLPQLAEYVTRLSMTVENLASTAAPAAYSRTENRQPSQEIANQWYEVVPLVINMNAAIAKMAADLERLSEWTHRELALLRREDDTSANPDSAPERATPHAKTAAPRSTTRRLMATDHSN
ncbi:MAG: hypothetical protein ACRED9_03190 [Caulobacteraceae bacterium]